MDGRLPLALWGIGCAVRHLFGIRRSDSGNPELLTRLAAVLGHRAGVRNLCGNAVKDPVVVTAITTNAELQVAPQFGPEH
jgi:hypothetical protein